MMCRVLAALAFGVLTHGATQSVAQTTAVVDERSVESCFYNAQPGSPPQCLGQAANACQNAGNDTTQRITQCLQAETLVWDGLLNQEYQAVRSIFAARDAANGAAKIDLRDALLVAQRAWIAYRDAECALAFARWQDGSVRSIVHANCMMFETAARAIELRDMKEN